jgi:hypothetical protein
MTDEATPAFKKPHISASQLSMFETCGESYRRRYVEGERIPPGCALLKGSGVHGGAKVNFRQKKESHRDLPKKDIVEAAVAEYEARINKDGYLLTPEEISVGKDKILGATKDDVASLSGLYATDVAPRYQPVLVEELQRILLPGAYDLVAVLDLADDQDNVIDIKTAAKSKPENEVAISEQLTMYALVHKALTGRMPKSVRLEALISTKIPKVQTLIGSRTPAHFQALVSRINTMIDALGKGVFIPCQPGHWKCQPAYCGYAPTCRYYVNK